MVTPAPNYKKVLNLNSSAETTVGMELRVGNRYRLGRKIGSGSFGDIYIGAQSPLTLPLSWFFLLG
jgi:hypothetical protein